VRGDQHVGQFMERAPGRSPLRLGLGGVLPPDIERGAAEVIVFKRGVEGILIDDARPRDIDQQCARPHQGKPAGVDQSCRFRRKGARDQDRVAQRQHAIEVGGTCSKFPGVIPGPFRRKALAACRVPVAGPLIIPSQIGEARWAGGVIPSRSGWPSYLGGRLLNAASSNGARFDPIVERLVLSGSLRRTRAAASICARHRAMGAAISASTPTASGLTSRGCAATASQS
jgi:hypothetical protein